MAKGKLVVRVLLGTIAVCAVLVVYIIWRDHFSRPRPVRIDQSALYPVMDVIDGDTFRVKAGRKIITVRMLGIDTPETVDPRKPAQCYGKEASDETKNLLTGRNVRLELNPEREVLDKYGRYLLYVIRDDGIFVNSYLLKNGFAREYTYGKKYSRQGEFRELERGAKENRVGLWGECQK